MSQFWVYLSASPQLWLAVTLSAYLLAVRIWERAGRRAIANPVVIATALVVCLLTMTGTSYTSYFSGAQYIHFLLGPTTVVLAVPLYRNLVIVRRSLVPMLAALLVGSITAAAAAVAVLSIFGAPAHLLATIAPKSATTPIAMQLSETLGGVPSMTAVIVILTGITGAVTCTPLMNALHIRNYAARGFASGLASHGIGTARALQVSDVGGAFAGIAIGMNGALTSVLVLIWIAILGKP